MDQSTGYYTAQDTSQTTHQKTRRSPNRKRPIGIVTAIALSIPPPSVDNPAQKFKISLLVCSGASLLAPLSSSVERMFV